MRSNLLTKKEAETIYQAFCDFPIEYIDTPNLKKNAWFIAEKYQLLTLYDSVFLAVSEYTSAQFWTADYVLLKKLNPRPNSVYSLTDYPLQ